MRPTPSLTPLFLLLGCIETAVNVEPEPVEPVEDIVEDDGGTDSTVDPFPEGTLFGGLHGTICRSASEGMQGVRIQIEHAYGVARTVTNSEGAYELTGVPAGEYVLVASGDEYFAQIPVLVSPNEVVELSHPECDATCDIPVPCVGVAEAMDRDGAQIRLGELGMEIRNTSQDLDVCVDDWMVVLSDASQDALMGQAAGVQIPPGASATYAYGSDVYGGAGNEAWWCVERWQYTVTGSVYDYNGSLGPSRLVDFVQQRTDVNRNALEDHSDYVDGQLQTQHNLWDAEREQPILLVGRDRSLARLAGPGSRPRIRVQVRNLGQKPGGGTITEVVPAGFVVSGTSPPAEITGLASGATLLTWQVELDAAQPDFTYNSPTRYDLVELAYNVSLAPEPSCQGRCEGDGVQASWTDLSGQAWTSASEPLVLEHCTPE